MLELQSHYKKNERKIILEENVYTRLLATINYTGFKMNITDRDTTPLGGYEYIVVLYGKTDENGNIIFSQVNQADYESYDGKSILAQDDLMNELFSNLAKPEYNCCAFIHTHPYSKTEACRVFSEKDINYYKTTFKSSSFSPAFKKDIINLGGIMTVSAENTPQTDDINFVYYNEENDEMEYMPNLYVRLNGNLIPIKQTQDQVFIDTTDGRLYNSHQLEKDKTYIPQDISRAYIELPEEVKGKSR